MIHLGKADVRDSCLAFSLRARRSRLQGNKCDASWSVWATVICKSHVQWQWQLRSRFVPSRILANSRRGARRRQLQIPDYW